MNRPTVSIVVATYNSEKYLHLALKSISKQTVQALEVLIADDGSSDATAQMIGNISKEFPCPIIHVWQQDNGFRKAAIINKALAKAKGEYIIHIDGDVILNKYFVEDHLSVSRKGYLTTGSRAQISEWLKDKIFANHNIDISPFDCGVNRRQNAIRCKLLMRKFLDRYKKDMPYFARGCNMAFWKKDFISVNGFNEDIPYFGTEYFEFVARLNSIGVKRQFIKFGAIQYHIYHKKRAVEAHPDNLKILNDAIEGNTTWCQNGVDKYMEQGH